MLVAGGADAHERSAHAGVTVRFARIEPTGLRVLRLAVDGAAQQAPDRVVRWLASRTAVDRRGPLSWVAYDAPTAERLREAARDVEGTLVEVAHAPRIEAVAPQSCHVVDASALVHAQDPTQNRLHLAWEAVAPGGVLLAQVPHRDEGEPEATFARIASALGQAGIAVADALACVPDESPAVVLEVTRL